MLSQSLPVSPASLRRGRDTLHFRISPASAALRTALAVVRPSAGPGVAPARHRAERSRPPRKTRLPIYLRIVIRHRLNIENGIA